LRSFLPFSISIPLEIKIYVCLPPEQIWDGYEISLPLLLFKIEIVIYRKVENLFLILLECTVIINERNSAKSAN
jgi:hypothetical protein